MSEQTISTVSQSNELECEATQGADELILLLECDRAAGGSARYRLADVDEVLLGRGSRRDVERTGRRLVLRVPDGRVSTLHARLHREGAAFVVEDATSKNGVVINGTRVNRAILRDGDIIECGRTFFLFGVARRRPANEPVDLEYVPAASTISGMFTFHEPLAAQFRALVDVARSPVPVLVLGPSGSGKELVARAVHALSKRPGTFVGVNCGALPENLVEAELFGARRGAFTGATEDRVGLLRASDQGTLFLDEIGDLPVRAQPAFLRALQEREVLPVGGTRPVPIDLRLVAATHRDLNALVETHQFRTDLLARISGFIVRLPPLRERTSDIGILIASLLARHATPAAGAPTLTNEAMRALLRYDWPLNIRELEHSLRSALALSSSRIDILHLPESVRTPTRAALAKSPPLMAPGRSLTPEQLARRDELRALLVEHRGNISQVARVLGKDRVQVRRWIRQFQLSIDELVG